MKDKRILFVSSELIPYLPNTEASKMAFEIPKLMQDQGAQVRLFMPKFGVINERRHQLHEVIRLSGMNLIINDMDMPLIIKVASIPKERMQVYFIDNDDYFKRKAIYTNEDNLMYPDNDERAIFFAKGVVETVKKLKWSPDIVHVSGLLASLVPLYIKEYYKNDPLFSKSKIVTSVYNKTFEGELDKERMIENIKFDLLGTERISELEKITSDALLKIAMDYSDAVITGSETAGPEMKKYLDAVKTPLLKYQKPEQLAESYANFYLKQVLQQ
jgi:starch synthase